MSIVLIMIALGAFGAWIGVRAQERRRPLPTVAREAYSKSAVQSAIAVPSSSPISYEQETSTSEETKAQTIDSAALARTDATETAAPPKTPAQRDEPSSTAPSSADPTIVVPEMADGLVQAATLPAKLPAELPEQPHKTEAKSPSAQAEPQPA